MNGKIPIGVSACLLGEQVRFDGGHKRFDFLCDDLAPYVDLQPICPEMAIGLPSPRPALRLIQQGNDISLVTSRDNTIDYTDKMQAFSAAKAPQLSQLSGFIVCAKSPSCGMERVSVYSPKGDSAQKLGVGLFTAQLMKTLPWLPVEENGRLNDPLLRENFIIRIFALRELNQLYASGLSKGALLAYHSRYKLLLLAHSQPEYRKIGPFVAAIDQMPIEAFFYAYRLQLMQLLAKPATRQNHTNVLQHIQGYFRRYLTATQRQALAELIDRYRLGTQPLLAPITLLKHYLAEYPDAYLSQQRYFDPYPEALRLRYGV
ncbi:membrane protein [Pragia fontium]|uniref:Membrane protein n=1 Tax=Pragia fontium TaxID=82985 RepID=A0ABQ5LGV4_9GAMM|nr:2-thiouracil desulfurase family protein [Pragia fontium]GKX62077.1 membrane protein [Pragia fontium]